MKILFAVLVLAVVAQVPSCESGDQEPLVGFVEDKYLTDVGGPRSQPAIVIHAQEYIVPMQFYREVDIGDLVRFEHGQWTIVRKASANSWDSERAADAGAGQKLTLTPT